MLYSKNMTDRSLASYSFFDKLRPTQRSQLEALCIVIREPAETVLFEQGDRADCIFILVAGEVHIYYKPEDGPPLTVARLRPESVVGWSAALGNPNYTSAAICTEDSTLLCIRGRDLRTLCDRDPELGEIVLGRLAGMIAERLRNTHDHVIALLQEALGIQLKQEAPVER